MLSARSRAGKISPSCAEARHESSLRPYITRCAGVENSLRLAAAFTTRITSQRHRRRLHVATATLRHRTTPSSSIPSEAWEGSHEHFKHRRTSPKLVDRNGSNNVGNDEHFEPEQDRSTDVM